MDHDREKLRVVLDRGEEVTGRRAETELLEHDVIDLRLDHVADELGLVFRPAVHRHGRLAIHIEEFRLARADHRIGGQSLAYLLGDRKEILVVGRIGHLVHPVQRLQSRIGEPGDDQQQEPGREALDWREPLECPADGDPKPDQEAYLEEGQQGRRVTVTARGAEQRDDAECRYGIGHEQPFVTAQSPHADADQPEKENRHDPFAHRGCRIVVDIHVGQDGVGDRLRQQHLEGLEETADDAAQIECALLRSPMVRGGDHVDIAALLQALQLVAQHPGQQADRETSGEGECLLPPFGQQEIAQDRRDKGDALRPDMIIEGGGHDSEIEKGLTPEGVLRLVRLVKEPTGQYRGEEERGLAHHHRREMQYLIVDQHRRRGDERQRPRHAPSLDEEEQQQGTSQKEEPVEYLLREEAVRKEPDDRHQQGIARRKDIRRVMRRVRDVRVTMPPGDRGRQHVVGAVVAIHIQLFVEYVGEREHEQQCQPGEVEQAIAR